jgi:hypothetical protein
MGRLILRSSGGVDVGGGGTVYKAEDWSGFSADSGVTVGELLGGTWAAGGYDGNVSEPGAVAILDRTGMPAGLLAEPNFPADKQRVLRCTYSAIEQQSRVAWTPSAPITTDLYKWWWEWRPNTNHSNEKWDRCGCFFGGGRGLDAIWALDWNSTDYQILFFLQGNAAVIEEISPGVAHVDANWNGGLTHWEQGIHLSTGTNSDGWVKLFKNGTLITQATGLRMFADASAAAAHRHWEVLEIGGWPSDSAGTNTVMPINRYICAWGASDTQQGVQPLT